MRSRESTALRLQSAYYVVTGLWPLLHRRSFEWVTGPKVDWWLVEMVGLLTATIGISLAAASEAGELPPAARLTSVCSAFSFTAIDVSYALRRRIRPVYLADAVLELAFAAALTLP